MIMSKEQIANEYVNLICDFYVGRATLWGYMRIGFNDSIIRKVEKNIKMLNEFLNKVEMYDQTDEQIMLMKKDIRLRIFEIEKLERHKNRAVFYYEMTIKTLMVLWETYEYLSEKYVDLDVLESRLNELPKQIDLAIKEMDLFDFSIVDLIYTKNASKNDLNIIRKVMEEDGNILSKHQCVIYKIEQFIAYIENRIKQSKGKKIFLPYGKDLFREYIEHESGIEVNLEALYEKAKKMILKDEMQPEEKSEIDNDADRYMIDKIKEIYSKGKEHFGESNELLNTLELKNIGELEYEFGKFSYLPSSVSRNKKNGSLLYSLDVFKNSECAVMLKLIHEIYPGHHHMFLSNFNKSSINIFERVYQNIFYVEGWAKYCEYYYAYNIYKTDEMIKEFNRNMSLIALMYIVTMDIHYYCKSYDDIVKTIIELSGLKKEEVISLIIGCYISPINNCCYFIGYNVIGNVGSNVNNRDIEDLHRSVLASKYFSSLKEGS